MKCRDVARILPELAASELGGDVADKALEHIHACQSCATEWAKYKKALGDLSQPREMADVPAALSALRLPKASGLQPRPVIAVIGVAMVLALVVLVAWPHKQPVQGPPVARDAQRMERAARSTPPVVREPSKPSEAAEKSGPSVAYEPGRAAKPLKHLVRILEKGIPTRPVVSSPTREAPVEELAAVQTADAQIIVVASWVEPPSIIEIESVDYATGKVRMCSRVTTGEPDGDQVIEMEWNQPQVL